MEKSKPLLSLLLIGTVLFTHAQNFNVPFRKGKLWGYADKSGKIVIEPVYNSVEARADNFRWFVFKDKHMGVIDDSGKVILPVEYDTIIRNPVHSRYNEFLVVKNSLLGYTDINGKFILPLQYLGIDKCSTDDLEHILDLNFLVLKQNEKAWCLIDDKQTVFLDNIVKGTDIYDGRYIFKVGKKWGIYSVLEKKWLIDLQYDSIAFLNYPGQYYLKKEYKAYRYFGVQNKVISVISKVMEVQSFPGKQLKDFFQTEEDNEDESSGAVMSSISDIRSQYTSVTGAAYSPTMIYRTAGFYNTDVKTVAATKENNLYGLEIGFLFKKVNTPVEFDEIKLLDLGKDYAGNNTCDDKVALVRQKKKWGIYGLPGNKLLSPVSYDSIVPDEKYANLLKLKIKNKMGVYQVEDRFSKQKSVVIDPEFDALIDRQFPSSLDDNYDSFDLYYFLKDGKVCPVGVNGVKFYEE